MQLGGNYIIIMNEVLFQWDEKKNTITLAITNQGKITVTEYDLLCDENGLYFEYGVEYTKIHVEDFEEV